MSNPLDRHAKALKPVLSQVVVTQVSIADDSVSQRFWITI
jgi:hypothetical protein